ncbi:MAG TPA: MFS transporter [Trebonia sp.]|jgi:MFS family permease
MASSEQQAVPQATAAGNRSRSNVRWLFIMPTLFVATLVAQVDKQSISLIMADRTFLSDMNLLNRPAVVGGLVSAFLISYGAGQFVWGPVIDRIGPRRAAMIGVVAWSVTLVWGGFSDTVVMLYLSRIFLGLAEGILYPVCNAFVAQWFAMRERGRAQSMWFNGATVGGAVGGAIVTAIIVAASWRTVFIVLAIIGIVVVLPMLAFLTRDTPAADRRVSPAELAVIEQQDDRLAVTPTERGRGVFGNYRYWLLVIAFSANNIFFWGWSSWLPTYLMQARHFSFKSSGTLTAVTFAVEVIAVWLLGMLTDRIGRRAPLGALGFLIAAVGVYIGGVISNIPLAIAIMIVGVSCQQACAGNVQALLHSFSGRKMMGRSAGVLNGIGNVVSFLAPTLIGVMVGSSGNFSLAIIFLAGVLLVAAVALALMIPSKY